MTALPAGASGTYLRAASQLQALSFTVHIPLVCFGIALPALVVFLEWRCGAHRRRAVPHAGAPLDADHGRAVRGRGDHRHDPVLRDGDAVAGVHGHLRRRVRPRLRRSRASRSSSRRSSSASTSTAGSGSRRARICSAAIPIVIAGITGSLMVIAVNAWMQHPSGFRLVNGHVVDVHPLDALFGNASCGTSSCTCTSAATSSPASCSPRPTRSASCAGAGGATSAPRSRSRWRWRRSPPRCRCSSATGSLATWPPTQPTKLAALEGLAPHHPGRPRAPPRLVRQRPGQVRHRDPQAALAARLPRPQRDRAGARRGPAGAAPAGQHHARLLPAHGRHRHGCWPCSGCGSCSCAGAAGRLPAQRWFYLAAAAGRAAVARRAGRRLDRHRGRPPAVGRLPRDDQGPGGHPRQLGPGQLRRARRRLRCSWPRAWCGSCAAWPPRRSTDPATRRTPNAAAGALAGAPRAMHLYRPPHDLRAWPASRSTRSSAGQTSAPGCGSWRTLVTPGGATRAPATALRRSASTPTTPWGRCGRPTTSGSIFVLTVTWTAYPRAFGADHLDAGGPAALAGVGVIFRGAAYALRSRAPSARPSWASIDAVFSVASLLTPFALGTMVGAVASGRVPVGNAAGRPHLLLDEPDLAARRRARRRRLGLHGRRVPGRRRRPLTTRPSSHGRSAPGRWAPACSPGRLALAGLPSCTPTRTGCSSACSPGRAWSALSSRSSAAAGTLALVAARRYDAARVSAALAVAGLIIGWALAQQPQLLLGLTLAQAAAPHATLDRPARRHRHGRRRSCSRRSACCSASCCAGASIPGSPPPTRRSGWRRCSRRRDPGPGGPARARRR